MKPQLNDTVRLLDTAAAPSLPPNALGVVVAEFTQPEEAYEIEFCDDDGATLLQLALRPSQFVVVA